MSKLLLDTISKVYNKPKRLSLGQLHKSFSTAKTPLAAQRLSHKAWQKKTRDSHHGFLVRFEDSDVDVQANEHLAGLRQKTLNA